MPNFEYKCTKCDKLWDDIQTIANRDKPTTEPCPHCKKKNCVTRAFNTPPTMGVDATKVPTTHFKERLETMRTNLGKYNNNVKTNIDRSLTHKGTKTGPQ